MNKILQTILIICGVIFIGGCLFTILGAVFVANAISEVSTPKEYTIEVTGDRILFSGVIMKMEQGSVSSYSINERIPETFTTSGIISSMVFQKQTEFGKMTVTIKDSGNHIVKRASTNAPYGLISIAL